MSTVRAASRLAAAALAASLGLLLFLGPLASSSSAATPAPASDSTFATLLNGLRTSLALGGLTVDSELSGIARTSSEHMANTGVLAHNPSLQSQAQGWTKIGENVAYGSGSPRSSTGWWPALRTWPTCPTRNSPGSGSEP